jgi:plasmid stability protein
MSQLIVRNIDEELVKTLKQRAARSGRSAEEEHRQILRRALQGGARRASLKEHLTAMPQVGTSRDFARRRDRGRKVTL